MLSSLIAALTMASPAPQGAQRIVGASLFKNGYALVTHEIDTPTTGGYVIQSAPQGSRGTVWFTTSEGVRVDSVVNTTVEKPGTATLDSLDGILRANVGKELLLIVRKEDGGPEQMTGKLVAADGEIVILQTADRTLVIQKSRITQISAPNGELKYTIQTKSHDRVLRVRVTASRPGKLRLMALERGITWAPGYAVDISDEKNLTLTAKATVLNDLADIDGIEMQFITGFPNVPFIGVPDPLTSGATVDQFISQLNSLGGAVFAGNIPGAFSRSGDMMSQNAGPRDMGGGMPVSPLEGIQAGDLFFYRQPNVSLKKDDRGYFILFRAQASYEHLYTWNVEDFVVNDTYQPGAMDAPQNVWHSLKFRNTSGQPLTTAAATTFKDGQILGQDMMTYTPVNAEALVRVSKALDVKAETSEEETGRERAILRIPSGYAYDLVTLRGTLTVTNRKTEEVKLKITKMVTGELVTSSGSPKVVKTAKGMRDVNPRTSLEWNTTVASGKTATFTYDYKLYVRTQ